MPAPPDPELAWVEPVSDSDLRGTADPQDEVVRREEISLAFVAALQLLAPRQRAALLLHDVLGFSHAEVAEVLELRTAAVNSLLSRARESVRATRRRAAARHHRPPGAAAAAALRPGLAAGRHRRVRPARHRGRHASPCRRSPRGSTAGTRWRRSSRTRSSRPPARTACTWSAGSCNGQPAFATYQPDGDGDLVASGLQVLQLAEVGGQVLVTALVSYRDPALAIRCGLPSSLA